MRERVDVPRAARHRNASRGQRQPKRLDKKQRGIVDGRRANNHDSGGRDGTSQCERRGAGLPDEQQVNRRAGLACHDLVVKLEAVTGRAELDARGTAGRRRGGDACDRRVLVEVQRAHRRGVARRQVVPRPARAQSFVLERVVITNNPAVDALDSRAVQRLGPLEKQGRVPAVRRSNRRVARSDDDQIADQGAVGDPAGYFEACLVAVVPPEHVRGGRNRQELHVRCRDEQAVGVAGVDQSRRAGRRSPRAQ